MIYSQLLDKMLANPASIAINILDIILAAYIVYRFLLLIRGTRGEQVLKGFIGVLLILLVARFLELKAIYWLLTVLSIVFVIGIPVVFQGEIRRILEYIGRGRIFKGTASDISDGSQTIDVLCEATERLARSRTGALIVLIQQQPAGNDARGGVVLDARLSPSLIENLFYTGSPLHDGAMIVADGRIYKAGAILPLCDNTELAVQVGTRHRAAIGISERIDAIVVVVSEESGHISLARAGRLVRMNDTMALRKVLEDEMICPEEEQALSAWRRLITKPALLARESLALKFFALVIACIIWSYVSLL